MRAVLGLVSLLVVLVIVALQVKQGLKPQAAKASVTSPSTVPAVQTVPGEPAVNAPVIDPSGDVRAQSQQIQNEVRRQLDAAMQQRPAEPQE